LNLQLHPVTSQSKTSAVHEALRESEQQFQLLVQGVKDYAIFMLDPQGRITTWNSGAERIKGYRAEEIIGEHFSRFYMEEDQREDVPTRSLLAAATEGRYEAEGWRVRKDGSRFRASVVIDAIRDDAGKLIGFAKSDARCHGTALGPGDARSSSRAAAPMAENGSCRPAHRWSGT
jgi:PAS domain S-box-containing protein